MTRIMKSWWQRTLWLLCLLVAGLQSVQADNKEFEKEHNFMVYETGAGALHFRLLLWAEASYNHWATSKGGNISTVSVELMEGGAWGSTTPVVTYKSDNGKNKHDDYGWGSVHALQGTVNITNPYKQDIITIEAGAEKSFNVAETGDNKYVEFDWYPPQEYMDKKMRISLFIFDGRVVGGDTYKHNYPKSNHWEFDLSYAFQQLTLSDAVFYPLDDAKGAGKLAVPYASAYTPVHYTTSISDEPVKTDQQGGMIYVNSADTMNYAFQVKMKAFRSFNGDEELYWNLTSNAVRIPAYHKLYDFQVKEQTDTVGRYKSVRRGHKRLTWQVRHADQQDIIPGDAFEIQRSYYPDFSQVQDVANVPYVMLQKNWEAEDKEDEDRTMYYEYVDSVPEAWNNQVDPEQPVYYRIRRYSSQPWGWNHAWAGRDSIVAPVYLSAPSRSHKVSVTEDKDYKTNRKIHLTIPLDGMCVPARVEHIMRDGSKAYTEVKRPLFWNETAQLVLTQYTLDHKSKKVLTSTETVIPQNAIVYNALAQCWEATYTDVVAMPCVDYAYDVHVTTDTYTTLPRMASDVADHIIATPIEGSVREYVVPLVGAVAMPNYDTLHIDRKDFGRFYFDEVEAPAHVTATQGDLNDHVLLKWDMATGACDYFRITKQWTEGGSVRTEVIDSLYDTYYEDYRVVGDRHYDYTVTSVLNCQTPTQKSSEKVTGWSNRSALIAGKVQYTNGMALSGITVKAVKANTTAEAEKATEVYTAVTDQNGTYQIVIPERPYTAENFYVMAVDAKGYQFNNGTPDGKYCQLAVGDDHINNEGYNLYSSQYVVLKGQVCYTGTSIPVPGVSFLFNGDPLAQTPVESVPMKNVQGTLIKTDTEGNYALTVPKGMDFSVQACKDGHVFKQDGYLKVKGSAVLNFREDMYEVDIWDNTTVRLIGRVAGGNDQAEKVLGMGRSVNNLGDDLQLVFALEGDDVSHFVYDRHDLTKKQRDTTFVHYMADQQTQVHLETKRVIVRPDAHTGEYIVELPPVKLKVTQATAKGYATLFAKDMGAAVVDLTDKLKVDTIDTGNPTKPILYNETYCINYHSPVSISYQQTDYGQPKPYYGDEYVEMSNFATEDYKVKAVTLNGDTVRYTFDHPIFNGVTFGSAAKNKYSFKVTAHEDYYYNNDKVYGKHDQVMMHGGKVKVSNGFDVSPDKSMEYVLLDSLGRGTAYVTVCNPSFTLTGEDALRSLTFSMDVNGEQVIAPALRAFVTGAKHKGTDVIGRDIDVLDVLRDPPGSSSYAWLESGATYASTYTVDFNANYGGQINLTLGKQITNITGIINVANFAGVETSSGKTNTFPIRYVQNVKSKNTYSYTYTTSERIQTSTDGKFVGNMGNVFIGTERSTKLHRYSVIAAISNDTRRRLDAAVKTGDIKILATGKDEHGDTIHLAISDQITFSVLPDTKFAYSQMHIIKNIMPELEATRNALLQVGTHDEIQAMANAKGEVMYRSKVPTDDVDFGEEYEVIYPDGTNHKDMQVDTIAALNHAYRQWGNAIANNERLEVEALYFPEKATNIAVSWGASQQYSETVSNSYAYNSPVTSSNVATSFLQMGNKLLSILGMLSVGTGGPQYKLATEGSAQYPDAGNFAEILSSAKNSVKEDTTSVKIGGLSFAISVTPVVDININQTGDISQKCNRTVGFKIEEGNGGHINVGVYRTRKAVSEEEKFNTVNLSNLIGGKGKEDINAKAIQTGIDNNLRTDEGKDVNLMSDEYQAADFVYYINGGATRCPYEPEEYTYFYHPGMRLGQATLKIDNPKIVVTNPVVGNVPTDQPAVFDLILSNETEAPEADEGLIDQTFNLSVIQASNPNGAKFQLDGVPFSDGVSIVIPRGQSVHKKLEVYRGTVDDYEDLRLKFYTACELPNGMFTNISVHFQPTSTDIALSSPNDKWIMNTLSPQDSVGYYLPIRIDGFDVNYRNFDHIELQYKKSTQPDDDYVNLRSYYADSTLYAKASGAKGMITSGVIDDIVFYGGNKVTEQAYDLRAVSFCRLGNSFVTKSSKVISGLKDTRRPQLFGSVTPKDGILGIGDYISIPFSEDIAGNYLSAKNNFQILGFTNKTGLINSTSLSFDGNEGNEATTEVERSLSDSDFSIDMMIDVDEAKAKANDMVLFSQGDEANNVCFGRTSEGRLFLGMMHQGMYSVVKSRVLQASTGWQRVVASYSHQDGQVKFYLGTEPQPAEGTDRLPAKYAGTGVLHYGNSLDGKQPFCGNMLESRLWLGLMDVEKLQQFDRVPLTGYERGLLAYYPMNEGVGQTITDKANGAHAVMGGQTWTLPSARSLQFDGTRGVQLREKYFERSESNNYTLGLWFKAEKEQQGDTVAIYAEGRGGKDDLGLFIGLEQKQLTLRQNGFVQQAVGNYQDGNWHHMALSVDRLHNVANLHVDGRVATQFAAENLGALGQKHVWLGQCNWNEKTGEQSYISHEGECCLRGNVDDVTLWTQALPERYVSEFYRMAPSGGEMGLKVNLTFSTARTNDHNIWENVYSGQNHIVKTEQTAAYADSLIVLSPYAKDMSDELTIAPVHESDMLTNINFSWASKDNELVINLDVPDRTINKQNVMVSVRDVEDLAGNPMADPLTWTVFVDRNALKWGSRYVTRQIGYEEEDAFTVDVRNLTGTTMYYEVEELPEWLEVDYPSGSASPAAVFPLTFNVANTLDPGMHSALIYLTDQNGLSEPLIVTVNVTAHEPEWSINEYAYTDQLSVIGKVMVKERNSTGQVIEYEDTDERDVVAAFMGGFCVGKTHISQQNGRNAFYMTVYGVTDRTGVPLSFHLWRASTGKVNILESDDVVTFIPDSLAGSPEHPVVFRSGINAIQPINFNAGWNWISFNIKPRHVDGEGFQSAFLSDYTFSVGDIIKSDGLNASFGTRGWAMFTDSVFNYRHSYMMRMKNPGTLSVVGTELVDQQDRTLELKHGWNYLPYFGNQIHRLNDALTDYAQKAQPGDIVKGYAEFAVMGEDGHWAGSLTHLRPGVGYMLKRTAQSTVTFTYPMMLSAASGEEEAEVKAASFAPDGVLRQPHNMPIVAVAIAEDGTEACEGDILCAYQGDVMVGVAEADSDGRFYLMTSAEEGSELRFTLVRLQDANEGVKRLSSSRVKYDSKGAIGTSGMPFVVEFAETDGEGMHDVVYDLNGRRMPQHNVHRGVYITRGKNGEYQKEIVR